MKLTALDLDRRIADKLPNCADSLPWPIETEPAHTGATAKDPAPLREYDVERAWPWWPAACVAAVLAGAFLPPLIERLR